MFYLFGNMNVFVHKNKRWDKMNYEIPASVMHHVRNNAGRASPAGVVEWLRWSLIDFTLTTFEAPITYGSRRGSYGGKQQRMQYWHGSKLSFDVSTINQTWLLSISNFNVVYPL